MKTVRAYSPAIEEQMQRYYASLSEKDRRRYAAIEAVKISYGGISYIHRVLGCVCGSIRLGIAELPDTEAMRENRQGVIFDAVETVKDLMATATTATGLSVFTTILDRVYETGKKATDELKASIRIVFDDVLPKWNYTALANPPQIEPTI